MSIQVYILSKLMDGNNYPYKLKKELLESIPLEQFGSVTESKLYYHFESLSKQGLIEPVEIIKEENRPDKQVFAITDKGRTQLPKKMYQILERAESIVDLLACIANIRFVERERVVRILKKRLASQIEKKAKVQSIYSHMTIPPAQDKTVQLFNGYFTDRLELEINWLEQLILQLQSASK